jgi:hypothetical protein
VSRSDVASRMRLCARSFGQGFAETYHPLTPSEVYSALKTGVVMAWVVILMMILLRCVSTP